MKFKSKKGDKLHLIHPTGFKQLNLEVEGFYCYGIKFKENKVYPFAARLFYSCGFSYGKPFYIVRKLWHYPFAKIFQFATMQLYSVKQFIFTRYMYLKHRLFC